MSNKSAARVRHFQRRGVLSICRRVSFARAHFTLRYYICRLQRLLREILPMYGMNKSELRLVPHDEAWKDDFAAERERIENAAGDLAVRVEHIGSTAIPGIYAKPVLDIAVLCAAEDLETVAGALRRLGYKYRGQYDEKADGHFYAVLDKDHIRYCQVHIYTEANTDWHLKLKFRDVLRENAELAREYNDYKLKLAKRISDKSVYAEIKDKWVSEFILKNAIK